MTNFAMKRKLESGEAIAVDRIGRKLSVNEKNSWKTLVDGIVYEIPSSMNIDDIDLCIADDDCGINSGWIWSVGKDRQTGKVYASTSGCFYENPEFECLWLR